MPPARTVELERRDSTSPHLTVSGSSAANPATRVAFHPHSPARSRASRSSSMKVRTLDRTTSALPSSTTSTSTECWWVKARRATTAIAATAQETTTRETTTSSNDTNSRRLRAIGGVFFLIPDGGHKQTDRRSVIV